MENDIKKRFEKEGRCTKSVENGQAICGVKLDCHLHDWRSTELADLQKADIRKKVVELMKTSDKYVPFQKIHYQSALQDILTLIDEI
jgi:hypothetical protein